MSMAALPPPQLLSRCLKGSRLYVPLIMVRRLNTNANRESTHAYNSGHLWDFTSDLSSKDTAYTNLALKAHTDTTYFTDPARLQMFHLLSHTEGEGGASLLVDGLRASTLLRHKNVEAYRVLSSYVVPCHSDGNPGVSIRPMHPFPVLCHTSQKKLRQVRWNNDDRSTLDSHESDEWYDAAREWVNLLQSPESEYWEQLKPGRPLSMYKRESVTG